MEIQSTLTLAIEIIFWAFVALMIFDFTNRLFVLDTNTTTFTQDNILQPAPAAIPVVTPQLEQEPDPWSLSVESSTPSVETSSVLLAFPKLNLLPPAKEIKQKSKRSKTSEKTKSTTKAPSTKTPQKGRSRKQVT
ncbi:hypothetical protein [Halotia branconii]|uniref:Uncharacterized protein n=1 Tax=Halotia branconii CENA392 TaxID=1539056 RepID=A0AAJ6NPN4_9CYAN|nr:hypothetical protein [Halotia branconii]WGV24204.1 hypothetical protein QI031_20705 [Halotia branconii CENA392]